MNGRPERIPWARTLAWDPIDNAMWLVWYARTVHASKRWPGRLAMRNPLNASEFNSENLLLPQLVLCIVLHLILSFQEHRGVILDAPLRLKPQRPLAGSNVKRQTV